MSLNKVMLIGRVGQIEVKAFDGQNGPRKCATFSFATTERYKDRNGEIVNNTEWHNIVSWNHAELCEKYVEKGSQLYIEGKLRTRSWEDKQGNKRYTTEVLAEKIDLLGKPSSEQKPEQKPQQQAPAQQAQPQQRPHTTPMPYPQETDDSDLPF
jgi:single-strand DNA-binding protein